MAFVAKPSRDKPSSDCVWPVRPVARANGWSSTVCAVSVRVLLSWLVLNKVLKRSSNRDSSCWVPVRVIHSSRQSREQSLQEKPPESRRLRKPKCEAWKIPLGHLTTSVVCNRLFLSDKSVRAKNDTACYPVYRVQADHFRLTSLARPEPPRKGPDHQGRRIVTCSTRVY